jgi:hypothetical protein
MAGLIAFFQAGFLNPDEAFVSAMCPLNTWKNKESFSL